MFNLRMVARLKAKAVASAKFHLKASCGAMVLQSSLILVVKIKNNRHQPHRRKWEKVMRNV